MYLAYANFVGNSALPEDDILNLVAGTTASAPGPGLAAADIARDVSKAVGCGRGNGGAICITCKGWVLGPGWQHAQFTWHIGSAYPRCSLQRYPMMLHHQYIARLRNLALHLLLSFGCC